MTETNWLCTSNDKLAMRGKEFNLNGNFLKLNVYSFGLEDYNFLSKATTINDINVHIWGGESDSFTGSFSLDRVEGTSTSKTAFYIKTSGSYYAYGRLTTEQVIKPGFKYNIEISYVTGVPGAPTSLDGLTDVSLTNPQVGDILQADSLGLFKNVAPVLNTLTDVDILAPTTGDIIRQNALGKFANTQLDLDALDDVEISGVLTGQVLISNGAGTFENADLALEDLGNVTVTNPQLNDVIRYIGGGNYENISPELNLLSNVIILNVQENDILQADGLGVFKNVPHTAPPIGVGDLTDTDVVSLPLAQDHVLQYQTPANIWTNVAPTAVSHALDSHTDVSLPLPLDAQSVVYDSVSSNYVARAVGNADDVAFIYKAGVSSIVNGTIHFDNVNLALATSISVNDVDLNGFSSTENLGWLSTPGVKFRVRNPANQAEYRCFTTGGNHVNSGTSQSVDVVAGAGGLNSYIVDQQLVVHREPSYTLKGLSDTTVGLDYATELDTYASPSARYASMDMTADSTVWTDRIGGVLQRTRGAPARLGTGAVSDRYFYDLTADYTVATPAVGGAGASFSLVCVMKDIGKYAGVGDQSGIISFSDTASPALTPWAIIYTSSDPNYDGITTFANEGAGFITGSTVHPDAPLYTLSQSGPVVITLTVSPTELKFYINGVLNHEATGTFDLTGKQLDLVDFFTVGNSRASEKHIGEMILYPSVLDPSQVGAVYGSLNKYFLNVSDIEGTALIAKDDVWVARNLVSSDIKDFGANTPAYWNGVGMIANTNSNEQVGFCFFNADTVRCTYTIGSNPYNYLTQSGTFSYNLTGGHIKIFSQNKDTNAMTWRLYRFNKDSTQTALNFVNDYVEFGNLFLEDSSGEPLITGQEYQVILIPGMDKLDHIIDVVSTDRDVQNTQLLWSEMDGWHNYIRPNECASLCLSENVAETVITTSGVQVEVGASVLSPWTVNMVHPTNPVWSTANDGRLVYAGRSDRVCRISLSISFIKFTGGNKACTYSIRKNGVALSGGQAIGHRLASGSGIPGDGGSASLDAVEPVTDTDYFSVWISNDDNTDGILVNNLSLTCHVLN